MRASLYTSVGTAAASRRTRLASRRSTRRASSRLALNDVSDPIDMVEVSASSSAAVACDGVVPVELPSVTASLEAGVTAEAVAAMRATSRSRWKM